MTPRSPDWAVLDFDGVKQAARGAAASLARDTEWQYRTTEDDLYQEALLLAALDPTTRRCIDGEPGHSLNVLRHRIRCDLLNKLVVDSRHAPNALSADVRYAEQDGATPCVSAPPQREVVGGYTDELIELLMPAVWDDSFAYGMQAENTPDADMPRTASNKATGNALAAHLADIRRAWQRASLSNAHRRALFLVYGCGWKQTEAAFNQGVNQSTVSRNLREGVDRLSAYLNGATRKAVPA